MWDLFKSDKDMSDYFVKWLDYFHYFPSKYKEPSNTCLSSNCFATKNILNFVGDIEFNDKIEHIKNLCEQRIEQKLTYFYLHMVDYRNGGKMDLHSHAHNEEYSFVYYLNTCDDGETILHLDTTIVIKPIKNNILFFSSNVFHSANYSNTKKVLVGGFNSK